MPEATRSNLKPRFNLEPECSPDSQGDSAHRVSDPLSAASRLPARGACRTHPVVPHDPGTNRSAADRFALAEQRFESSRYLELIALRKVRIAVIGENVATDWQGLAAGREDSIELQFCETEQEASRLARALRIDAWILCADSSSSWCIDLCSTIRSFHNGAVICLVFENYSAQAEQLGWLSGASLFLSRPMLTGWLDSWLEAAGEEQDCFSTQNESKPDCRTVEKQRTGRKLETGPLLSGSRRVPKQSQSSPRQMEPK